MTTQPTIGNDETFRSALVNAFEAEIASDQAKGEDAAKQAAATASSAALVAVIDAWTARQIAAR